MKKILFTLLMSGMVYGSFAQNDAPDCLDKVLPFLTPMEGYYLTDFCEYSEFRSFPFFLAGGSRSIVKEGIFRGVWYQRKDDSDRKVLGLQILDHYVNAVRAVGGKVLKESDGNILITTYQGKELWILVGASAYNTDPVSTYYADQDNYGIFSIEVDVMKREVTAPEIKDSIAFNPNSLEGDELIQVLGVLGVLPVDARISEKDPEQIGKQIGKQVFEMLRNLSTKSKADFVRNFLSIEEIRELGKNEPDWVGITEQYYKLIKEKGVELGINWQDIEYSDFVYKILTEGGFKGCLGSLYFKYKDKPYYIKVESIYTGTEYKLFKVKSLTEQN